MPTIYPLPTTTEQALPVFPVDPSTGLPIEAGGAGTSNTQESTQLLVKAAVEAINTATGTVTASPEANTVLARLKDLLTGTILAAGSAIIGKVGIDQTTPGTTDSVTVKASSGIGSLTETAPASDTASSGLNGRLQRVAQNLTSLIALVPASLGTKTKALSLSVTVASSATLTNGSGTITTGGTAQNALASNASRQGFFIQNNSTGNLWFSTLATAVQAQPSIKLLPDATYETPVGGCGTGALSVIGATTSQAFTIREW